MEKWEDDNCPQEVCKVTSNFLIITNGVSFVRERVEFKRCIFSVLYHLCPKFGKEDKVKCKLGQFKIIT